MSMTIEREQRVGDIVAAYSQASNVFKEHGIDFCCGGKQTLAEVARKKKLDEQELVNWLNQVCTVERPVWPLDWRDSKQKLTKLIEHIVHQHHDFLRRELPVLRDFVRKVARVHGADHPELITVEQLYVKLCEELLEHVDKEEKELFPVVRKAEEEGTAEALQAALNLVEELEAEHDGAGELLRLIRKATNDFVLPAGTCMTYTVTFRKLEELEDDMFTHVHLENNLLFPELAAMRKAV